MKAFSKRILIFYFIVIFLTGCTGCLPAEDSEGKEDMEAITAWDVVNEMKIGWNLGNTLDCTNTSLLKALNAQRWETVWGNPVTTKELLETVIDAGFNVIRIPVSWNDHIYLNDNYRIEESWMDRVQEVVDYAYDHGAYVILNTHHESWYYPYYENEERAAAMLEAVWDQIAKRFADYDEHLIFEGMNEPRKVGTDQEWNGGDEEGWAVVNSLNRVFVDTIRNSGGNNPDRILMVTGYGANCWNALSHLEVPEGDSRIIVSVHAYEPYDFALNVQGRGLWNQDTEKIDALMNSIDKLFISKGIPVIIGEFGVMVKPAEGNEEERAMWAEYYVSAAKEIGVVCIWWDNGFFEGDGELFGLIDRETCKWKYSLIMEGLMKGCGGTFVSDTGYDVAELEAGMIVRGNWSRLKEAMKKAEKGEEITVGFLGGSITQGSLASAPENSYAYLVWEWWNEKFPDSTVHYQNAGIGGTTSQFGAARVDSDLLAYRPDVIITEFSVNDENTLFFKETYEGLVRKMLKAQSAPAVILLYNVVYDSGYSAQEQHSLVGWHYDLPCVSMKASVYPLTADERLPIGDITPDGIHPNDTGHGLIAGQLICLLEKVYAEREVPEEELDYSESGLPTPLTKNAYENSIRYQNDNISPVLNGFTADTEKQESITDLFKNGWTADREGASIRFEVEGSEIAVQYRKSVTHPACIAKAVVDGQEDRAIILDGNFDETWGDCLYLQNVLSGGENKIHTIEITITDAPEGAVPFYMVSVIGTQQ